MEFTPDYILIPYQLIKDETLTPLDRTLYGVIYYIEKMRSGKCEEDNKELAEYCNSKNIGSIRHSLNRLENGRYILKVFKDDKKKIRKEIKCSINFEVVGTDNPTLGTEVGLNNPTQTQGLSNIYNNKDISKNNNNKDIKLTTETEPQIKEIYELYKKLIHPKVILTKNSISKIKARLKEFEISDIKKAIKCFSGNNWRMKYNANKGLVWFFRNEEQVAVFLILEQDRPIDDEISEIENKKKIKGIVEYKLKKKAKNSKI